MKFPKNIEVSKKKKMDEERDLMTTPRKRLLFEHFIVLKSECYISRKFSAFYRTVIKESTKGG